MARAEQLSDVQAEDLLRRAFDAYNRQDADALLTMVSIDVRWPDNDGYVMEKGELRAFWRDQWAKTRTHDEVTGIERMDDTKFLVRLNQMVRTVDGTRLSAGSFCYGFTIENGLIAHLSSRESTAKKEVRGS